MNPVSYTKYVLKNSKYPKAHLVLAFSPIGWFLYLLCSFMPSDADK
jgi:hypothetical protein